VINPARFAPGACAAYPPTALPQGQKHRVLTVFLDAGHGGPDPGGSGGTASGRTVVEKGLTLAVVKDTVPILTSEGFRVVVSRTSDSSVRRLQAGDIAHGRFTVQGERADNAARARCADESGAAVLVAVHFDAAASPRTAGALTIYDSARTFWRNSQALASSLQSQLLSAMNGRGWAIPNNETITDTHTGGSAPSAVDAHYGHLIILGPKAAGYLEHPSTMPGALVEPLFLTDPFEASIASSSRGQRVIAEAIASGIGNYLAETGVRP
jgi:N-acetylmuramoyl-L-alanine amidase